jgi:AAA domain/FtsX-like permease family
MPESSWNKDVRGTQVPPLINSDADTIRCVAGPGSGKTFGLVRRVERILHPEGLAVDGEDVLVVAFNRVIARQLREDIHARLKTFEYKHAPVIRTIHALCVEVIGEELRLLLPHEVDAMVYDILEEYPDVDAFYDDFYEAEQALRDHEAGHEEHPLLWQAVQKWLLRHKAHLVSDVPRLLLERLKGGDFPEQGYDFVIVDEFQDLTPGEQELMFRLRRPGGQILALGDPRQSIYTFRGNDREGLAKLEKHLADGQTVTDIGVVRDAKLASVRRESGPMMYLLASSQSNRLDALVVRATGDPDAVARAIQQEIRRVNPRLLVGISTMRQEIDRSIATERMVATTSAFFCLLGLLLVSIGIFGVASYTVAQRTNELGIRMALGAGRWSVIRASLRETMVVFGAGLAVGIIAAITAVRLTASFISDLLFGLTATDAINIAGAVVVMVGVALAACILPARRATRIDALAAIRHE